MPDTMLDPILADRATAGAILCGLRLSRQALASPDYVDGRPSTPVAFYHAIREVRGLIWDAVDNGDDCNRSQDHADAIAEALGIAGIIERIHAIKHLRRTRSDSAAYELTQAVGRQLSGAITRLTLRLADDRPASN